MLFVVCLCCNTTENGVLCDVLCRFYQGDFYFTYVIALYGACEEELYFGHPKYTATPVPNFVTIIAL